MNDKFGRALAVVAVAGTLGLTVAACSTNDPGSGSATATHSPAPAAVAAQTPSPAPVASSAPAASSLAGTWSGQYSGAYSGSFTLTWKQSGSRLHGSIHLSNPDGVSNINGTVSGTAIQFGTVGSTAITYSGTVSGSSMSGEYDVHGGGETLSGEWSATRS
jgi:hypothetical protein